MKHVLKFALIGLILFSFKATAQVGDAVKGVIMNKKVQNTVIDAVEEKVEAQDTAKKKVAAAPVHGPGVDSTAAGFAINDPGLPNEKTGNTNAPKGNVPVSKPVLTPPPSGGGASNFAINEAGLPNENNSSNNKATTPAVKPEEKPKTEEKPK